jgi:FtsP/CotA-like multicopper oxidase with cupredoxin domain
MSADRGGRAVTRAVIFTTLGVALLAAGLFLGARVGGPSTRPDPATGATRIPTPAMSGMDHGSMPEMPDRGEHAMRPVDTSGAPDAAWDARGNQPLTPTLDGGVKEFRLTAGVVRWSILPDVHVGAYAYNGQVPGPEIRLLQGDRARFILTNELPEPTTVHWHGSSSRMSRTGPRT